MAQAKSTARKSTARKSTAERPAPASKSTRRAFSILSEEEVGTLEGVKLSALPKASHYRVRVTHDRDGNPNGFDCEPIDPEEDS